MVDRAHRTSSGVEIIPMPLNPGSILIQADDRQLVLSDTQFRELVTFGLCAGWPMMEAS